MENETPDPALRLISNIADIIWSGEWDGVRLIPLAPMIIVLLGAGILFMIRLKFYPILKLPEAVVGLFRKSTDKEHGEISPFAALSTALSGQVGTGNLAGVATAITLGGPGALFWMWITAIFGMALAFAEGSLSIRYRVKDENGHYRGGPMNYIRQGLGKNWGWLAILFSIGTLVAAAVTGNMIQANAVADSITGLAPAIPEWGAGVIVAIVVFIVIIGGIRSIGSVAEKIVPTMAVAYIIMAAIAVLMNIRDIPLAFVEIFQMAFTGHAAGGGIFGAGMMLAIRAGVARGLFSNEAGQGSTAMAHAVAQTSDPASQGRFAMMGTFIDTIVICTMTGLVLLTVEGAYPVLDANGDVVGTTKFAWESSLNGFAMTSGAYEAAFSLQLGGVSIGALIASLALILFSFTTLLTWSYYGERAITYLSGGRTSLIIPWRVLWCVLIVIGSFMGLEIIWRAGDIANAMMAFPNLIALVMLSSVVVALAKGDRTAGPDHEDIIEHLQHERERRQDSE